MSSADGATTESVPVSAPRRRWRSRGYLVTMGTVVSLAGGMGLTVLGLGAADQAVASFDAASWVWSQAKGEMARINGVTAKVDTRVNVPNAAGHQLEVSQTDRFVILRDRATGRIGTMDLTTLQQWWNGTSSPGLGVRVALQGNAAFVVDTVQGQVQQIDPGSLSPLGKALRFPPGITGGAFDGKGRLWIAAPSEGTVTAIAPAAVPSAAPPEGGGAASAGDGPHIVRTEAVAPQSHDLALSTLSDGVAVLNRTTNALAAIHDGQSLSAPVTLPLAGPGALPAHTDGLSVPVTVPDARHVYVVRGGQLSSDFTVPGSGSELQPAVAWQGFFYVADAATGAVHVFDAAGQPQKDITFAHPGGQLELDVREGYLFINAPGSSTARVVDDEHRVRTVDKYADDVLGGDPPDKPDQTPPPPKPRKPTVSKPGAPRNVRAAAGNAEARVTWQAAADNGAAITRYVVSGAGRTFQVGADQRSLTVTGLTNGETYEFTVHAVNKKGDGPDRTSNSVKPTSEVPDAPTAATAEAKPDGTVVVSWPAANGQGHDIKRYTVTAISEGGSAPVGDATETSLTIPAGSLEYGKQYAFTVVSVNDVGAGSKASPVSGSVVPYNVPGQPQGLDAATSGDTAGAVVVSWQAAAENGRAITEYLVTAGGKTTEVTGTSVTLTGLGTGANVSVEVKAVNEAGEGPAATATAQTMSAPKVTITGVSVTYNSATVALSVDAGGASSTTCKVAASGAGSASGDCKSLAIKSLTARTSYTFTATVTNKAGSATASKTTSTAILSGTATCINGADGDTATYCDKDVDGRNGNEIFSVTKQDNDKQVGWVKNGTKLQTYCKKSGTSIDSYIYNDNKVSSWWIQIDYDGGKPYIPFAWLNLDGGDNINNLKTC